VLICIIFRAGILDKIQKEFNANDAMMGLLQTAFIVSYMFFAPLFGYLGKDIWMMNHCTPLF
jgi:predicted MFS family arabinose efflux permease